MSVPAEGPILRDELECPTSHFRNPNLSPLYRYGVVVYLLGTFALLLASDIASGVAAYRQLVNPSDPSQNSTGMILQASIFTSIPKLWNTGSYALTILIVIASVSWPFVKILLSLYAWCAPFANAPQRRERLLEVIDALGKWSFVDVVVFSEIVVAFHSTIYLGGPYVEIYIVPRWGLIGFVSANMMCLVRGCC
jgi:Paraquat-inducible protein A